MAAGKETGASCSAPISKLQLAQDNSGHSFAQAWHSVTHTEQMLREIQSLRVMQAPFGKVFWFLEQKIARSLTKSKGRT